MHADATPTAPEALVILPGLLCDSRMFAAQVAAFDAVVIDGFYDGADRFEAMATLVLERMPARCALLGHSMGARVALEVYRRAPGRIARLALADTGTHAVRDGEAAGRYALRALGEAEGAAALVDAWLPPMIGPARRDDPLLRETLRTMAISAGMAVYRAQTEALLHRPEVEALLPAIDCPALVVVGRDDAWSPVDQHRGIAAAIPGARLRIVEGAGHMLPAERPDAFNEILRDWLTWPARPEATRDAPER